MREYDVSDLARVVRDLCISANVEIREDHLAALARGLNMEKSPIGCRVLQGLIDSAEIAKTERLPFCQDTGYAVVFLHVGQEVHFVGGDLVAAVNEGVANGYRDGYLRASIVKSPIDRRNTGDNTPAMIYSHVVPGEDILVTVLIKGAGCDNMSAIRMLTPAQGVAAMKEFVVDTIKIAGPSASLPVTIGIGMGGTFDKAAYLAKWALTRESRLPNADPEIAALEREIEDAVNATGIGAAGFGGTVTTVAVHIESMPTHIAAFPVAINIDCHSHRVRQVTL
ncbi:fumarate hydratase [Microbacterium sp. 22303]|uniref:fumarate hydratase n=1 Tax=Microbacterium sp. 22303 TaxID=3453905 RepID=UPI003F853FC0